MTLQKVLKIEIRKLQEAIKWTNYSNASIIEVGIAITKREQLLSLLSQAELRIGNWKHRDSPTVDEDYVAQCLRQIHYDIFRDPDCIGVAMSYYKTCPERTSVEEIVADLQELVDANHYVYEL